MSTLPLRSDPTVNSKKLQTIKDLLASCKISSLQLDPFGFCNSKCWFCPVAYQGNPASGKVTMAPDLLEKILLELVEEKGRADGLVVPTLSTMYTAHYNEVLLYKHFDEMTRLFSKYRFSHMILSNGLTLSKDRVDLIASWGHTVSGICLNIPAFTESTWSKATGLQPKLFSKLVENVKYAHQRLVVDHTYPIPLSIQINCLNPHSLYSVDLGPEAPQYELKHEAANQHVLCRLLFPGIHAFVQPYLVDRVGHLPETVISNRRYLKQQQGYDETDNTRFDVVGCTNTVGSGKGRPYDWLHINAEGKVILCCNDYSFDYVIGDLSKQTLRDFWASDQHCDLVYRAFSKDGICAHCTSAVYGKERITA